MSKEGFYMKKIKSIFAFLMLGSLTMSGCSFEDLMFWKKGDDSSVETNSNTPGKKEDDGQQSEQKYTVSFNANGGSGTMAAVQAKGNYFLPQNGFVAPTSHTFNGWKANNQGQLLQPNDPYVVLQNIIFYAQWKDISGYIVTFDVQGHGTAPASQDVEAGGKVSEPTAPSVDGYNFEGWYKEAGCVNAWNFASDTVSTNITLYAKWTETTPHYLVTFDVQDHGTAPESQNIEEGGKVSPPAAPEADGFTFGGWYTEPECEYPWNFETDTVVQPFTLYAKWVQDPQQFTVTFDGNGATSGEMKPFVATEDQYFYLPQCTFQREGYYFVGWAIEPDGEPVLRDCELCKVPYSVTLYAYWLDLTDVPQIYAGNPDNFSWGFLDPVDEYEYCFEGLQLDKGQEFVIKLSHDDWRYYENYAQFVDESAVQYLEQGQGEGNEHNFKVTYPGSYDIFIKIDKDGEGPGLSISIHYSPIEVNEGGISGNKLVIRSSGSLSTVPLTQVGDTNEYTVKQELQENDQIYFRINGVNYGYGKVKWHQGVADELTSPLFNGKIKIEETHTYEFYVETDPLADHGEGIYITAKYLKYGLPNANYWKCVDLEESPTSPTEYRILGIKLEFAYEVMFNIDGTYYKHSALKDQTNPIIVKDENGGARLLFTGEYDFYIETSHEGPSGYGIHFSVVPDPKENYYYLNGQKQTGLTVNPNNYSELYIRLTLDVGDEINFYYTHRYHDTELVYELEDGGAKENFSVSPIRIHCDVAGTYDFFIKYTLDDPVVFVSEYKDVTHTFVLVDDWAADTAGEFYAWVWGINDPGHWEALTITKDISNRNVMVATWPSDISGCKLVRFRKASLNKPDLTNPTVYGSYSVGGGEYVDVWNELDNILIPPTSGEIEIDFP